ncbi:MAG: hypothetical protein ABSD51_14335 [Candidatus Binatus sp.]
MARLAQEYRAREYRAIGLCGLLSLAGYLALAILSFGRALFEGLSSFVLGKSTDTGFYVWSLVWWPHAVAAGINPFITKAVWAPLGFNLSWAAAIPLASFVAYPLTASLGPVASYNLLVLLCPALAAWSAFLLCRYISDSYWPSFLGGYIFGFSPYILYHIAIGHLNLLFVFPIPLAVYLVLLRLDDQIRDTTFSLLLAAVFITQFLLATELFATLVVFGAIGILVFYAFAEHELRERIARVIKPVAISLAFVAVLLAPYFYYMFTSGFPSKPVNSPTAYSVDVLNFFIPSPALLVGANSLLIKVSDTFTQGRKEPTGYLCLPLLIVLIWFGYRRWGDPIGKALVIFVSVICVLSIGPRLHFAGHVGPGMPWKLATHLPLLNSALPSRFMIYPFLALAVVVSLLLSGRDMSTPWKYAATALIVLFLLPDPLSGYWVATNASPEFFTTEVFKQYLVRNETVVVLPYGMTGNSMLWQAESDMYYRMAGGYTSAPPDAFLAWPITNYFLHKDAIPDAEDQLKAFLSTHDVRAVLVTDEAWPLWKPLMSTLATSFQHAGGVYIYRVPAEMLARYRTLTATEMETRLDTARFDALLIAAQQYVATGGEVSKLTPFELQSRRLLPSGWVSDRDIRTRNGLYVAPAANDEMAVGITGSYEALKPTIKRYCGFAREIYFPYPRKLSEPPRGNTFMRLLVMDFSRDGLAKAAQAAKQASAISPVPAK